MVYSFMTEQEKNELSGRLFALELFVVALLDERIRRLPDKGHDTEHLDALVEKLQASFEAQAPKMTASSRVEAEKKIKSILGASLSCYWQ